MTELTANLSANAIPVPNGSSIQLLSQNASTGDVALTVRATLLTDSGQLIYMQEQFNVPANTANQSNVYNLTASLLLTLSVSVTGGNAQRGQVYSRANLYSGTIISIELATPIAAGYISDSNPLTYPLSPYEDCLSGFGTAVTESIADPGADTPIQVIFGSTRRISFIAGEFLLTTDANVANRVVNITITRGSSTLVFAQSRTAQVASTAIQYILWIGENMPADNATTFYIPIPNPINSQSLQLDIDTTNRQSGDAFTSATLNYHVLCNV